MTRRRLFSVTCLVGAAVAGSVATIAVRGGTAPPSVAKPPPVTTATVVRTTLTTSILTEGTLGYTSSFTVTTPGGSTSNAIVDAQQVASAAEQKVSADESALSTAIRLANDSATVPAARSQLVGAELALAAAHKQLSADEQLGCPAASTSSSPGTASGSASSFGSAHPPMSALDATVASPEVSIGSASGTTTVATELSGTVNPNGVATSFYFRYGTSTAMASSTPVQNLASTSTATDVSATVDGLSPNTTYLFTLVAKNSTGTTSGIAQTFTTAASSCVVDRSVIATDRQAVTQARDAFNTALIGATNSVTTAQQQLAADQASAKFANQALVAARASASNPGSILTGIAAPNTTIHRGGTVYELNGRPVPLLYGTTVPSRALYLGVSGPDVVQLNANLAALGFASGIGSSPHFSVATQSALRQFQASHGLAVNGVFRLGDAVFAPGAIRIANDDAVTGTSLQPGAPLLDATSTKRVVTVPLNPSNAPMVSLGEQVWIYLPSNARTPGRITSIGPVPPSGSSSGSVQANSASTTELSVRPTDSPATGTAAGVAVQISLTTNEATNVLAAPISALVALAGGGYGVEVVEPSGVHRLVGVTTGLFSNTLVELRGGGIQVGTKVVVAQ